MHDAQEARESEPFCKSEEQKSIYLLSSSASTDTQRATKRANSSAIPKGDEGHRLYGEDQAHHWGQRAELVTGHVSKVGCDIPTPAIPPTLKCVIWIL